MMATIWPSLTASAVCGRFTPGEEALPPGNGLAREYFERLCHDGLHESAIGFVAHALPAREAVWWGCLCLWDVVRPVPPPSVDVALAACLRWVFEPVEGHRRAAERAAAEAGDVPVGYLAQAVFYSGGSVLGPDLPVASPPPFLTNRLIAGAVLLVAGQGRVDRAAQLRLFLGWAADVADAKNHWSLS